MSILQPLHMLKTNTWHWLMARTIQSRSSKGVYPPHFMAKLVLSVCWTDTHPTNQPTSHPLTPKLLFTLSLQHLTISKQCLPFSVSRKESLQSGRLHRQLFNFRRAQPPRHRTWEDDDRDEYSGRGSCPSSFYVWTDAWAELLKLS